MRTIWALLLCLVGLTTGAHAAPEVVRLVTARAVVDRQPEGITDRFSVDAGRVFAWAHLRNTGPATHITWVWRRDGEVVHRKRSKVGAQTPRWRSWSRRWVHPEHAGAWRVSVETEAGVELASTAFVIGEGAPPVAEPAAPTPPPATEPEPGAPTAARCRAWIDVRGKDGRLSVVEIDVTDPKGSARTAPGLVVLDDRAVYALAKISQGRTRVGRLAKVSHRWDEVLGRAVPSGETRRWAGMPANLPAPSEAVPPDRPRHEVNLIEIESVIGPYVGVRQGLSGDAGGLHGFDHSRYATVIAPGEAADPTILVDDDLPARAFLRARTLHPSPADAPDPMQHDYRRSALSMRPGGPRLLTLMPCCTWRENRGLLLVDVPVTVPSAVAARLPDDAGWWRALDGCGQVRLAEGTLQARAGDSTRTLSVPRVAPAVVLGVAWPPADLAVGLSDLRKANRKLLESKQ